MVQEVAQLPDSKVEASFADELFAKVIGLPAGQQDESYEPPHTKLQVESLLVHSADDDLMRMAIVFACTWAS